MKVGEIMSLYVTRHGQTDYNVDNRVCGKSDARLTDLGIEQAKSLVSQLENLKLDYLYVSPLKRAIETANQANSQHQSAVNY